MAPVTDQVQQVAFRPLFSSDTVSKPSHPQDHAMQIDEDEKSSDDEKNDSKTPIPNISSQTGENQVQRLEGGMPVTFSKVNFDNYSLEDTIIRDMKTAGFKDIDIQKRLIKEGLTRYSTKTIAQRWGTIRDYEDEKLIEELDEELTDWHDGDDDDLAAAKSHYQHKLDREIAAAIEKFYSNVSFHMHGLQEVRGQNPRFSKNACKTRDEALKTGNALPVYELDPDQAGRMLKRQLRTFEIVRNKADKGADQWHETQRSRFEKTILTFKKEESSRKRDRFWQNQALSKKKIRTFADKVRAVKQSWELARTHNERNKSEVDIYNEQLSIVKIINKCQMYRRKDYEMAQDLKRLDETKKKCHDAVAKKQQGLELLRQKLGHQKVSDDYMVIYRMDRSAGLDDYDPTNPVHVALEKWSKKQDVEAEAAKEADEQRAHEAEIHNSSQVTEAQPYSWFAPRNPRSKMSVKALRRLARLRGIDLEGKDKFELIYALAEIDNVLELSELRNILRERGVAYQGRQSVIQNRLCLDDGGNLVNGSDFYQIHVNPHNRTKRTFLSLTPNASDDERPRPSHKASVAATDEYSGSESEEEETENNEFTLSAYPELDADSDTAMLERDIDDEQSADE